MYVKARTKFMSSTFITKKKNGNECKNALNPPSTQRCLLDVNSQCVKFYENVLFMQILDLNQRNYQINTI